MSCHLRSPNDRVRHIARTEFILKPAKSLIAGS
jgi:hypothetical protein